MEEFLQSFVICKFQVSSSSIGRCFCHAQGNCTLLLQTRKYSSLLEVFFLKSTQFSTWSILQCYNKFMLRHISLLVIEKMSRAKTHESKNKQKIFLWWCNAKKELTNFFAWAQERKIRCFKMLLICGRIKHDELSACAVSLIHSLCIICCTASGKLFYLLKC